MDLLGKARRLESAIARRFDRAARDVVGAVPREPLEIVHLVIEAVAHEIQPGGRGKRVFPFNSVTLSVLAGSREERAILIRDPNKLVSVAVLSSPKMTEPEIESIAKMGSTGNASGDHLHFEIRDSSGVYDPMDFMPERGSAPTPSFAHSASEESVEEIHSEISSAPTEPTMPEPVGGMLD